MPKDIMYAKNIVERKRKITEKEHKENKKQFTNRSDYVYIYICIPIHYMRASRCEIRLVHCAYLIEFAVVGIEIKHRNLALKRHTNVTKPYFTRT